MKEYGGYLPLDSAGIEYYYDCKTYDVVRLNAARYAIVEAVKDCEVDKVWVPVYTCHSIFEALEKADIRYEVYNLTTDFYPDILTINDTEMIVITNYYGVQGEKFYQNMVEKYKKIIFDNTQSFFQKPIIKKEIYNVYSPRKFVGVSDGAYLIAGNIKKRETYKPDYSVERAKYLLQSLEVSTNDAYDCYLASEQEISNSGIREMSKLTQQILGNVNYELVRKKRVENFRYLNDKLGTYNMIKTINQEICPMVYPFMYKDETGELRDYLVKNKIYVPHWWKWVEESTESNAWEKDVSKYLLPLPIDQRYSSSDMKFIYNIVKKYVSNKWRV